MMEKHPFDEFVPKLCRVLILGSFPGKESTQQKRKDDWYYGANRNQFWKILEEVYQIELKDLKSKQKLFSDYGIGITDIIESCSRRDNKNSDKNLVNITFNTTTIDSILQDKTIEKILFTSIWVAEEFENNIEPILKRKDLSKQRLPSPSPVFRRMSLKEKAEVYKQDLPKMSTGFIDRVTGPIGIRIVD